MVNSQLPDLNTEKVTLGEYTFAALQSLPPDLVIQQNGITGDSNTVQEVLELGVAAATALRNKFNVQPGDILTFVSRNSPKAAAFLLGSAFNAAVFYSIDVTFKQYEMSHMLRSASPKLAVVSTEFKETVELAIREAGSSAKLVVLEDDIFDTLHNLRLPLGNLDAGGLFVVPRHIVHHAKRPKVMTTLAGLVGETDKPDVKNFKCNSVSDNKRHALILHSSGTTGLPKGVAISHRAALNQVLVLGSEMEGVRNNGVYLMATAFTLITGLNAIFSMYIHGIKRVYLPITNADTLIHSIDKYKPTFMFAAPVFLAFIINHLEFKNKDLSSLKTAYVGGTPMPEATLQLVKDNLKDLKIHASYGATELGAISNLAKLPDTKSVGYLSDLLQLKVLDVVTGKEVGCLVEGEMLFKPKPGRYSIMTEYINNSEATREAFDSDGYFRTGDMGYRNADNLMYLCGRIKEMIDINDSKIPPHLIEDQICKIADVIDVAVTGIKQDNSTTLLRALVVLKPGSKVTAENITSTVAENMGKAKHLTGGVQFVDNIPRNRTGKIVRGQLAQLIKY